MTYAQTHGRKMYCFDSKVINEQACRDQAIEYIAKGGEKRIEIHKHRATETCKGPYGPGIVVNLENTQQLLTLPEGQCYAFTHETDVVSGR